MAWAAAELFRLLRARPRRILVVRVGDDPDGLEAALRLAVWRWPDEVDLWLQYVGRSPETRALLERLARAWGVVLLDGTTPPPAGARVRDWGGRREA
ncbi:MAG: hypothetical protein K6V97_08785 [Actinomycetia bacterium]|nr:hypothetical protein [Actinomycetes bacterium]